jgi:CheY-like chemotaxis protein
MRILRPASRLRHTLPPDVNVQKADVTVGQCPSRLPVLLTPRPRSTCDDRGVFCSVLIVDDDPAFLRLAARIVGEAGAVAVATASDAAQALEVVRDCRPDAVIVDIGLPDRDGVDLAYELAELPWEPHIVLMSSDSEAFAVIELRDGHRRLPFIPKEELASDTLLQSST